MVEGTVAGNTVSVTFTRRKTFILPEPGKAYSIDIYSISGSIKSMQNGLAVIEGEASFNTMGFENTLSRTNPNVVCGTHDTKGAASNIPFRITAPVASDTTPPTTTATATANGSAYACGTWTNKNVNFILNAQDNQGGSGVKQITYSASGAQNIAATTVPGSSASFVISAEGVTKVDYLALDKAGNLEILKTCTVRIDKTPPKITCPSKITTANKAGLCGAFVTFTPTATDNVGVVRLECSPPSGAFFGTGSHIVTCTAEDAAGNRARCSFEVEVRDLEAPKWPVGIVVRNDPGQCGARVNFQPTDNCGVVRSASSPASGSFFPVGTTKVAGTAQDAAGNVTTAEFLVTVEDKEAPTLLACPPTEIIVNTDPGKPSARVETGIPAARDNCGQEFKKAQDFALFRSDGGKLNEPFHWSIPNGPTIVQWVAVDKAGNKAMCTQKITVHDREPPKIVGCPPNVDVYEGDTVFVLVTDNADPAPKLIASIRPISGNAYAVTVFAIDLEGNPSKECVFTVRVWKKDPARVPGGGAEYRFPVLPRFLGPRM